ncbi:hypothetical protein GL273_13000 [Aeromonas jandaei]|uniref:hypothetical protein n=1 Tax=Aeromonas jandaei TaxID=650 RepID=UPI001C5BE589|nr:hypothetical protein [Aeromonas jandaei]MBW3806714.1 hypothetical protein [Aeromonas jandaei]
MNDMQQKRPSASKKTATTRVKHRLLQIKNATSQKILATGDEIRPVKITTKSWQSTSFTTD